MLAWQRVSAAHKCSCAPHQIGGGGYLMDSKNTEAKSAYNHAVASVTWTTIVFCCFLHETSVKFLLSNAKENYTQPSGNAASSLCPFFLSFFIFK